MDLNQHKYNCKIKLVIEYKNYSVFKIQESDEILCIAFLIEKILDETNDNITMKTLAN